MPVHRIQRGALAELQEIGAGLGAVVHKQVDDYVAFGGLQVDRHRAPSRIERSKLERDRSQPGSQPALLRPRYSMDIARYDHTHCVTSARPKEVFCGGICCGHDAAMTTADGTTLSVWGSRRKISFGNESC